MKRPVWYVKVTSKGQITLPKEVRDAMVIREGDHLETTLSDDSIVLTRREPYTDSEQMRIHLARQLRDLGVDPNGASESLRAPYARQRIAPIGVDVAARIRSVREGRDEVLS